MVNYPHRFTKVTMIGSIGGGAEMWTTGFHMGNVGADADLPNQQLADDIRDAWRNFFTPASSWISNNCSTTTVKVSSVGVDGKSNAADTVYSTFPTGCNGGQPNFLPPQLALVATFTSPRARGVASKGRMYLPCVVRPVDNTGHIDGTNLAGILGNLKTFFQAVNNSTATNNVVMLTSRGSVDKAGNLKPGGSGPDSHEVSGLKLGNVYDTQRRRRNGIAEQYQTVTLAP